MCTTQTINSIITSIDRQEIDTCTYNETAYTYVFQHYVHNNDIHYIILLLDMKSGYRKHLLHIVSSICDQIGNGIATYISTVSSRLHVCIVSHTSNEDYIPNRLLEINEKPCIYTVYSESVPSKVLSVDNLYLMHCAHAKYDITHENYSISKYPRITTVHAASIPRITFTYECVNTKKDAVFPSETKILYIYGRIRVGSNFNNAIKETVMFCMEHKDKIKYTNYPDIVVLRNYSTGRIYNPAKYKKIFSLCYARKDKRYNYIGNVGNLISQTHINPVAILT